jgi:hypothetical protein
MQRLVLLLLAFHSVPALGQYQYYGVPNDGGMGAMSSMPPAPPPVSSAPTYPGYGSDMSYGAPGYPSDNSGFSNSGGPNIINYGFLEGGYQYQDPKNSSLEGSHGLAISLSAQLFKPLFIKADFGWSKSSGNNSGDYDFTSASLGAGAYLPLFTEKLHLLVEAGGQYGKIDAERDNLSFTEGAVYVRPAVRFAPLPFLEFQSGITFTSADEFDTFVVDVGAYFRVLSQLDLGLNLDFGDEFTGFTGGIRFRW